MHGNLTPAAERFLFDPDAHSLTMLSLLTRVGTYRFAVSRRFIRAVRERIRAAYADVLGVIGGHR